MYVTGQYFYGNKISDYGLQHNRVDYRTLAKAFDAVLNNDIMQLTSEIGYWVPEGSDGYYEDSNGKQYDENDKDERIEELEKELESLVEPDEPDEDEFESEKAFDEAYEAYEKSFKEWEDKVNEIQSNIDALDEYHYYDFYQFYIVSDEGARILKDANEMVWYNEALDMYVWGVSHWGTSWDYVLTNIPCNCGYNAD